MNDVACPACFSRCVLTRENDVVVFAMCPECKYELEDSIAPVATVRELLDGVKTGTVYDDVDLGVWTRNVVRSLREM